MLICEIDLLWSCKCCEYLVISLLVMDFNNMNLTDLKATVIEQLLGKSATLIPNARWHNGASSLRGSPDSFSLVVEKLNADIIRLGLHKS